MTSHIHMIIRAVGKNPLESIIRDLKSFTSRSIRKALEDVDAVKESRREWMLHMMYNAGIYNPNNKDWQLWQQHSNPIELNSNESLNKTLDYIHLNPVEAGFVSVPEAWIYSSAGDYYGTLTGPIELLYV